jgi:hypothetical protein
MTSSAVSGSTETRGTFKTFWPNQIACCQEAFFEAQSGSNEARFLSTP